MFGDFEMVIDRTSSPGMAHHVRNSSRTLALIHADLVDHVS